MSQRINIYLPAKNSETMKKLGKILYDEHLSFSHWIMLQAEAYVAAKENPQPQKDISTSAYPPACVVCGGKAEKWGLKDTVWIGYCSPHFDNMKWAVYR